ncbi:hypothetical protein C8R46DRAFT_1035734 [Mycena filopes]|nr:hypothetical protein C8R46DRAFT_1035734 [Mycena filopes]
MPPSTTHLTMRIAPTKLQLEPYGGVLIPDECSNPKVMFYPRFRVVGLEKHARIDGGLKTYKCTGALSIEVMLSTNMGAIPDIPDHVVVRAHCYPSIGQSPGPILLVFPAISIALPETAHPDPNIVGLSDTNFTQQPRFMAYELPPNYAGGPIEGWLVEGVDLGMLRVEIGAMQRMRNIAVHVYMGGPYHAPVEYLSMDN